METDMWRLFLFVSNWYLLRSFFTYFKCSRIPIWRIWFVLFALRWNDPEDPGLYDLKWMDEDLQSTPLSKPLVMFDLLEPLTSYFMLYNYIVYFTPFIGGRYCAHWDILIRCWFITLWLKFLILPPWCHLFSITSIFRCIQTLIFKMSFWLQFCQSLHTKFYFWGGRGSLPELFITLSTGSLQFKPLYSFRYIICINYMKHC